MSRRTDDAPQAIDTGQVNAEEFARNLASLTDEQLDELITGPLREQILAEVFSRMEHHFRGDVAGSTEAVIWWRIGGHPDGEHAEYETVIAAGTCKVREGFAADSARVKFTIGGPDFLRLVTGHAAGPMLFMTGKLKIEGDMMFAAQTASLFRIPSA
jgi:putative sterol carrier protein